jgi:hypothetical protein
MKIKWSKSLWPLTKDEWAAMSEEEQRQKYEEKTGRSAQPVSISPAPLIVVSTPTAKPTVKTAQAPKAPTNKPAVGRLRNWNESVKTKDGRIISGERLCACIQYLLDVRRDPWYSMHLTKGFVLKQADKLDADTPEDVHYYLGNKPLFGLKRIQEETYEVLISTILRHPENEEERLHIREKFGVTIATRPYLTKKDCPKCKGKGVFEVSSYPDDPLYERLGESVDCDCSFH